MTDIKAHTLAIEEIINLLNTKTEGLSDKEAERRLKLYGRNEIEERKEKIWLIFLRQFRNPLVYILIAASIVSFLVSERVDFFLIVGIIFVNSLIGFFQEYKAITSLEALKKITELSAKVLREGKIKEIPSSFVVPGDILLIEEGDVVPADIRLIESEGLLIDESVLTGESIPVEKEAGVILSGDAPIYERKNIAYKGTLVVRGYGKGVAYATGSRTEFGKISIKAGERSPESPLTKALESFSRKWMLTIAGVLVVLFFMGIWQGRSLYEVSMLVIAELVSAVPEGLPIVITLVLVVGALRLSRRKTYIRYLPSAETLGSTTFIAADKTGTITEGKLKVKEVFILERNYLYLTAALCNNTDGMSGDPLEIALISWLEEEGIDWKIMRNKYKRVKEFPFDTRKRYMITIHRDAGGYILLIKGAFESLLELSEDKDGKLIEIHNSFAESGLRVLAFGYTRTENIPLGEEFPKVKIAGLIGFIDPPKRGVREAVEVSRNAGIKVIMITGANLRTAKAVAKEVQIYRDGDWAIEGKKLENYTDDELYRVLQRTTVVARALPEDKYRIIRVLQNKREVVAVTGDGVNDVPALKIADIGIAMGSGSQAAKDVAKMVITDNNLSVIIDAIKWGRIIARNIRRAIYYLLSSSFDEVLLLSFAFLFKLPLPLYPTQILWINLVTDGVQDKAFPFNKEEIDVMKEKPKRLEKVFFDRKQMVDTLSTALFVAVANLILFVLLLKRSSYESAVSTVFTSMVANQWFNGVQTVRDMPFFYKPWKNFTANPYIYLGLLIGLLLQISVLYLFPEFIHAKPLNLEEWMYVLTTSSALFLFIEMRKILWLFFDKTRRPGGVT